MTPSFGFFGKLPSQGDFVSRRMPWDFTETWDAWLQAGLAQARERLGAQWLAAYLNAPVWRFALAPGLAGASAWAGLWFPSVDRVGRHFPMTVAAAVPAGQPLPSLAAADEQWLALEDAALAALDPATSLERFDALLLQARLPEGDAAVPAASAAAPAGVAVPPWQLQQLAPEADAAAAAQAWAGQAAAPVRFFSWGSDQVQPTLLGARGLPPPPHFSGFLLGMWDDASA
jgi:type VI secretion system protein ImpM